MNVSKLNQKNFLRIVSFVCALPFLSFSILTSAEKPRLPNTFKVFKVAVIGSDVRDARDVGSVQDIKMDVEDTKVCEDSKNDKGDKGTESVKIFEGFEINKNTMDIEDVKGDKDAEGVEVNEGFVNIEGIEGDKDVAGVKSDKIAGGVEVNEGFVNIESIKGDKGAEVNKDVVSIENIKGDKGAEVNKDVVGIENIKDDKGAEGVKSDKISKGAKVNKDTVNIEGSKSDKGNKSAKRTKVSKDAKRAEVTIGVKGVKNTKVTKETKSAKGAKDIRVAKVNKDTVNIEDIDYGVERSLNKFTVNKLCSCGSGKKLSGYEGVTVNNGEIELYKNYPVKVSEDSIFVDIDGGRESVVLSFYNVKNCDEARKVIPECQFAICPFFANLNEMGNGLEEHLTRLRDFVKKYNEMCDVRFLYYTNNIEGSDNIATYRQTIGRLCKKLYTNQTKLQQDIQSHQLSAESGYEKCIGNILYWRRQRAIEFERCMKKEVVSIDRFKVLEKIKMSDQVAVKNAGDEVRSFLNSLNKNDYSGYEKLYSEIFNDSGVVSSLNQLLNDSVKKGYDEGTIKKKLEEKLRVKITNNGMKGSLKTIKGVGMWDQFAEAIRGDGATIYERIFCSRCDRSMYNLIYHLVKSCLEKGMYQESEIRMTCRVYVIGYVVSVLHEVLKNITL